MDGGGPRLKANFSRGDKLSELNRQLSSNDLRRMLEGNDFRTLDMIIPFIACFMDCATGLLQ